MKQNLPIILLFIALVVTCKLSAQSSCQEEVIYKSSSVGNGKESLPFPLIFFITTDTLRIADNEVSAKASENVPYLITEKTCNWNDSHTEGKAFYKLTLNDRGEVLHPTLSIEIKEHKGQII